MIEQLSFKRDRYVHILQSDTLLTMRLKSYLNKSTFLYYWSLIG